MGGVEDWLASLAEMGLQVLKGTLISLICLVSNGGASRIDLDRHTSDNYLLLHP